MTEVFGPKRRYQPALDDLPAAVQPIVRYRALLRRQLLYYGAGTLAGVVAFTLRPHVAYGRWLLLIALVWALLAAREAWRNLRLVRGAGGFPPGLLLRPVDIPLRWSGGWPMALLFAFGLTGGLGTAGAYSLAAWTPELAQTLVTILALARREQGGAELFIWQEYDNGKATTQAAIRGS